MHKAIAQSLGPDGSNIDVTVKATRSLRLSEIKEFSNEIKIMMFLQRVKRKVMQILSIFLELLLWTSKKETYTQFLNTASMEHSKILLLEMRDIIMINLNMALKKNIQIT